MFVEDITVAVPSHPARAQNGMLARALDSVYRQRRLPTAVVVANDLDRQGSAATRNRALAGVTTDWVAFLDSDDELHPEHLERLAARAAATGADVVYPWFTPAGGQDPWPAWFGQPFDEQALRRRDFVIPVTVLARARLLRAVGGFRADLSIAAPAQCDDWGLWLRLLDAGATFSHLPLRTWTWHMHAGNTSGSPELGDARSRTIP